MSNATKGPAEKHRYKVTLTAELHVADPVRLQQSLRQLREMVRRTPLDQATVEIKTQRVRRARRCNGPSPSR